MDGRTRGALFASQTFSSCPPRVIERRAPLYWFLQAVASAFGFLHTRPLPYRILLTVALLVLGFSEVVPDPPFFRSSITDSVGPLPRRALQSFILQAKASDVFQAEYGSVDLPSSFSKIRVQNSIGTIHPVRGFAAQNSADVAQANPFALHLVEVSVSNQHGRRLAASDPEKPADSNSKEKRRTALESELSHLFMPPREGLLAHRRDSEPNIAGGTLKQKSTDEINCPYSSVGHSDDLSSSASRTRRCASFSNLPPVLKKQTSPTHYPLRYRDPHPYMKIRNPLPWDIKKPHSPPVASHMFPREGGALDNGPHALLHDKPYSVAEALWSEVSATEKSAFDEMEEKKPKSSSMGKASGSRAWPRPDSRQASDSKGDKFSRVRASSLSEQGNLLSFRRSRSSPGLKKRRSTEPESGLRRSSHRVQPTRSSVDEMFTPSALQFPSEREASGGASSPSHSARAPLRHSLSIGDMQPSTTGWPSVEEGASRFRHVSEPSPRDVEKAEKKKGLSTTPSAGGVKSSTSDTTTGSEFLEAGADSDSGDDDFDITSSGDLLRSSQSTIGQSDDEGSAGSRAESRASVLGDENEGGDRSACPTNMINLMFDVYYNYLMQDSRLRRQFALLVLSSIQWPLYTNSKSWRRPQLQKWFSQLTELANETLLRETEYSYGTVLLEEMKELGWVIRSVDDFQRFLRAQSYVDLHLREMLSYVPEHRLAISLKPELLEEVYNATAQLQFIYYYSSAMKNPEASSLLQWKFIREVHLRWSMLQLLGITHQLITRKPLQGVLILQVDKIDTKEQEVLRLFDVEENKTTQEALLKFETTVTDALTRRIKMVAKHFQKVFSASDLNYSRGFQLPKCQVTAFYLKPEGRKMETSSLAPGDNAHGSLEAEGASSSTSDAIETGLFGFEIDVNIAKDLKDRLPRGSMYIQLSLVDGWDYQPVYKPPLEDPNIIPAHRATQILKANLEHDPSLFNVGLTKVIYTTILDAYNASTPNLKGYDNDRHLILRVPLPEFETEEVFLASIVAMVSVPSIHNAAPRTVNPHRIKVMGSARRLSQGEVLKTGNFLSGIDYRRHKSIEAMVDPNTVAVHIFLEGIKEKGENSVFELEASTIFDRLVRRGRNKFTVMHAETVPKKTVSYGNGLQAIMREIETTCRGSAAFRTVCSRSDPSYSTHRCTVDVAAG